MRKRVLCFGIILIACFFIQAYGQTQPDEKLFQDAKILIFDKKWEKAQKKLEELMERYPGSAWFSQALFYEGKCLGEQKGKELEALNVYKKYLLLKDRNESLDEESEISIMDLASVLYEKGKKSYLEEIEKRAFRKDKVIRYYAAFKLSYMKDNKLAKKAVPILTEILEKEQDDEFRDRAKIALLRVDPDALRDFTDERGERKARILHIRVANRWKKEPEFSLNIPWALADLALRSIPENQRAQMREEGYDLDKIIRELTEFKGKIIEIETKDSTIKIWID